MRLHYSPKKDLLLAYPQMDNVQSFADQSGIRLQTCAPDYLLSIAFSVKYKREHLNPELAALCRDQRYPESVFDDALNTVNSANALDLMPNISIDGKDFGAPDYELIKLRKSEDASLALVVGAMTGCCGHIGGLKKKLPMVKAMVTRPDVGCYIVRRKGDKRPAAKLTAWLSKPADNGTYAFVINAWHTINAEIDRVKEQVLKSFAEEARRADPHIAKVYIGCNGNTFPYSPMENEGRILPRDPAIATKDTNTLYQVASFTPEPTISVHITIPTLASDSPHPDQAPSRPLAVQDLCPLTVEGAR